jgi:hypothetical protein
VGAAAGTGAVVRKPPGKENGDVFTFGGLAPGRSSDYIILRNGVQYAYGAATTLTLVDGVAWADTAANQWWSDTGGSWTFQATAPSTGGAGQAADLTGAMTTLAGPLQIDTTAPTVTQAVSSVATGEVIAGQGIRITLDTNEAVTVSGTPVLLLNDGGMASYDAVDSTTTALAFNYNVTSEVTTDLVVSGIQMRSTSSIADLAGNNANLSGAGADLGLQVNTKNTGTAGPSGGNFTISGSTELELFGASTANATFAPGDTGVLWLDASSRFNGVVAGLALGNSLDLADIAFGSGTSLVYTPNGDNTAGTLSANDGSHNANIALLGQYMASSFVMASDGHGGTLITDPPSSQTQILSQSHG